MPVIEWVEDSSVTVGRPVERPGRVADLSGFALWNGCGLCMPEALLCSASIYRDVSLYMTDM